MSFTALKAWDIEHGIHVKVTFIIFVDLDADTEVGRQLPF